MTIAKHKLVSIDYTVKGDDGEVIDSSEGRTPLSFVQGMGSIIPGLETALEGKEKDDSFKVTINPEDAYGHHAEELIQTISSSVFQGMDKIEVGMRFNAQTSEGPRSILVTGVDGDDITVDANHPLAGKVLHFEIKVCEVRDATEEEIAFAEGSCSTESCSSCSSGCGGH